MCFVTKQVVIKYIKVILPTSTIEATHLRKEIAIISVTRNGRITIPEEIRKELKISDGDKIKVELQTENDKKAMLLTKLAE